MKRLLTVSFITILAVLPMVASAEVFSVADPTTDANAAVAETNPKWALAEAGDNDDNLATAGYVKGAYNQTMKAINKVATTVGNAADKDLSNLSATGTGVITTAITNNAAGATYSNTTSGLTATTIQGAIDEVEERVDSVEDTIGNTTLTTTAQTLTGAIEEVKSNALTSSALTNYAKKTGVENTIETATITARVPTLTTWGNDNSTGTVGVEVVSIAATYAEPTPPEQQGE